MARAKKGASKRTAGKKRKTPGAAPGKSDPGFLTRLSKAIHDEYEAAAKTPSRPVRGPASDEPAPSSPAEEVSAPRVTRSKAAAPASGTGSGKTKPGKNRRPALLQELKKLIEELDEEGLEFLLEQAHVHRYNMEVERLNEAEERKAAREGDGGPSGGPAPREPSLRIERSKDGNTYHVVSAGRYKMFSADEMLALVRIAHSNPAPEEAARGLHRWMSRERIDALADLGISGPADPSLLALSRLIVKTFAKPLPRK